MGVINPGNTLSFKSSDALFSRVNRRLKTFDAAGVLDQGEWYQLIKTVLDALGAAVYDECDAVVMIKDFKGPLPDNFSILYAAYKCTPNTIGVVDKKTLFPQTGFVFYIEETHQPYRECKNCLSAKKDFADGEKITIRTYIQGQPNILSFTNPKLLRLSGNAKSQCDPKCKNLFAKVPDEITISNGFIYTNFKEDSIFLKYQGLALDSETGLPMIPDNTIIEKAIEDYIIYRVFEDLWINNQVPDIENRYKVVRMNSDESFANARVWCKMPSFQSSINKIRNERKNLRIYQQIDWY